DERELTLDAYIAGVAGAAKCLTDGGHRKPSLELPEDGAAERLWKLGGDASRDVQPLRGTSGDFLDPFDPLEPCMDEGSPVERFDIVEPEQLPDFDRGRMEAGGALPLEEAAADGRLQATRQHRSFGLG